MEFLAPRYLGWLLDGWLTTLWCTVLVVAASTLLGVGFAAARESRHAPLVRATGAYLSLFRNTPLLVQLFFWYFGVPALLPEEWVAWLNTPHALAIGGATLPSWPSFEVLAAIVGLVACSTAYVGEEIRSGLRGVRRAQHDAALALGFTPQRALRHVILPQALRIAAPPLFGQYMNILKNTSLGMAVGLMELSYRSRQVEAQTWKTFQVYGAATLLYVLSIVVLQVAAARVRRRGQRAWETPRR